MAERIDYGYDADVTDEEMSDFDTDMESDDDKENENGVVLLMRTIAALNEQYGRLGELFDDDDDDLVEDQDLDEQEQEVEDPLPPHNAVAIPATPPSASSWASGPFQIRISPSGDVESVTCNLGDQFLYIEREADGATARWRVEDRNGSN